jgi:chemotaxis family two-component system sensor kinase Cph1
MRKAEELAQLTDELQRSNKELEAFSYSVSHDLRAPFRHIVGYAELLKDNEAIQLDERSRRYVDTIIESAFSAGKLVDDLLGFSQMGRTTLMPIRIDMNRLLDEVRRMLRPDTQGRRIDWRVEELAPTWGDPGMLRQVVQNLLANAVKYTPAMPSRPGAALKILPQHRRAAAVPRANPPAPSRAHRMAQVARARGSCRPPSRRS